MIRRIFVLREKARKLGLEDVTAILPEMFIGAFTVARKLHAVIFQKKKAD